MLYSLKEGFKIGFKKARKEAGYTQKSFSEAFQYATEETIKNWEQGRNLPELGTIEKLCDFFHCDIDYLFGNIDYKTYENKYICEKTGLSEKALFALETYQQDCNGKKLTYGSYSFGTGCEVKFPGAQKLMRIINEALEIEYDHLQECPDGFYVGNLLKLIDDYFHPFDFDFGLYEKSTDNLTTFSGGNRTVVVDKSSKLIHPINQEDIYRHITMDKITKLLMNCSFYLDDKEN